MLKNEEFARECRRYYAEEGIVVDRRNGEFAHCPLPRGMGEEGYYLLHEHHQQQGLLQSEDLGRCCFWNGDAKKWLMTCETFPDDYFGLWDLYDKWAGESAREMVEEGSGIHAEGMKERGRERAKELGVGFYDPLVQSAAGRKAVEDAAGIHNPENAEKVYEGRVKGGRQVTELGLGAHTPENRVKGARSVNAKKRVCLVTGHISTPAGLWNHQKARGIPTYLWVALDAGSLPSQTILMGLAVV